MQVKQNQDFINLGKFPSLSLNIKSEQIQQINSIEDQCIKDVVQHKNTK